MEIARALVRKALQEGQVTLAEKILCEYPAVNDDGRVAGLCLVEGSLDLIPENPGIRPVNALCAALSGGHPSSLEWVEANLPLEETASNQDIITIYLAAARSLSLHLLPANLPPPPEGTLYYALIMFPLDGDHIRKLLEVARDNGDSQKAIVTIATADGEWRERVDAILELCGSVPEPDTVCSLVWSSGYPQRAAILGNKLGSDVDWLTVKLEKVKKLSPVPPEEVAVSVFPHVDSVERLLHLFTTRPEVDWGEYVKVRLANTLYTSEDKVYQYLQSRWPEYQTSVRDSPVHLQQALLALCYSSPLADLLQFRETFPHINLTEECVDAAARGDNISVLEYLLGTLEDSVAEARQIWEKWVGYIEKTD